MLETLIKLIEANYIIEENIPMIVAKVRELSPDLQSKDPIEQCKLLNEQLKQFDRHFHVSYDPEKVAKIHQDELSMPSEEVFEKLWYDEAQQSNFGFQSVQILEGNIGYINLTEFAIPKFAKETASATIQFVQHTNAIIFDLRRNGGGSPDMVQLLISHLISAEPQHLITFHYRPSNHQHESWTLSDIDGVRLPDTPVYVLTSSRTGSGAEEFAYDLKHMKRATIVGETTHGAAHPVDLLTFEDAYLVAMPTGRPIHAITGDNWEQKGVTPHIQTSADQSLPELLSIIIADLQK